MVETTKFPVSIDRPAPTETGFASVDRMRQEMDRLLDEFGRGFPRPSSLFGMPDMEPLWRGMSRRLMGRGPEPLVDVIEQPDRYGFKAELPGMDETGIEVTLANGSLILKGEKQEEKQENEANYHLSERNYGSFQRSFRLPDGIDPERIEARFKNGLLTVVVPKTEEARQEKKVSVKAA